MRQVDSEVNMPAHANWKAGLTPSSLLWPVRGEEADRERREHVRGKTTGNYQIN